VIGDFGLRCEESQLDEFQEQSCELLRNRARKLMSEATDCISGMGGQDRCLSFTLKDVKNVQQEMVTKTRTSL
jgi:hypothetical protein